VLRAYLPTCNAEDINIVFGPIGSYVLEDEDSSMLQRFTSDGKKVSTEKVNITQL